LPDGRIAYISDKSGSTQIWTMKSNGSEQTQVSNIEGGINSFETDAKGGKVMFTKDVKLDETPNEKYPDLPLANVHIANDLMYRHWNTWHDYAYSHVFWANIVNGKIGEVTDIIKDEKFDSPLSPYFEGNEVSISPDGRYIAYTCKKLSGKQYAESTNSDVYIFDTQNNKTINVSEGIEGYDKCPVFSPDSKQIAWQSMSTPGYESDIEKLMVADVDGNHRKCLSDNLDQSVTNITWNTDGKIIYFISGVKATFQVYSVNISTGVIRQITSGMHDYNSISLSNNGVLVGEKMSMSLANEIFKIDVKKGTETQLSFTNKNIYDNIKMGKVLEKWVRTTDNKQMLTYVILPPDFDSTKRYPALLFCNGGPQSAVSQFFSYRWNFQIMAANGYVIIAPNRRGTPTFGSEWLKQISGDYGGQNMDDYLSATDAVAKEPYVDANRLGAVGPSYGGYSIYYLAGHHNKRFKAFIAHCGMFNLESQFASTEEYFFVNHDLGGAYWQTPKPKSYQFSPHLFVQNWDTPIMMITGEKDFRIPYTESLQAFNAAQLRGVPSRLLVFPDETHFVVKPQNAILWQREFFGWLDKWLK
jgi:dipeptidyl aminopeptidase/acylaminoacyl peptidase